MRISALLLIFAGSVFMENLTMMCPDMVSTVGAVCSFQGGCYGTEICTVFERKRRCCALPKSFLFVDEANNNLPVGFSINGSAVKRCKSNSECANTEFCNRFHNNCLDKSDNGSALNFCYQDPKFANPSMVPLKLDMSLQGCHNDTSCQHGASCDTTHPIKEVINGVVVTYPGICYLPPTMTPAEMKRKRMAEAVRYLPTADETYFTSDRISVLILLAFSWLIIFAFCCICFLKQED